MRTKVRNAAVVVLLVAWLIASMILWPPKKWEDLTPEEQLNHDFMIWR